MSAEYNIIIRGANGTKRAEVSDFQTLSYTKRVNEPGLLTFRLNGSHAAIAELEYNGQVEVQRRINGSWYTDFYGLYRGYSQKQSGQTFIDITCPGQMTFLADEHIAFYANTTSRNIFTSAAPSSIMRTIVRYNCDSTFATTGNSRLYDTKLVGIICAADPVVGTTTDWTCAWSNVLTECQKIALASSIYFDLVKAGSQSWEFTIYGTTPGTDRSADVTFSVGNDNMTDISFTQDRTGEKTMAIVAGEGREGDRQISLVYGPDYSASNQKVMFVDASQAKTSAARTSAGNAALEKARARAILKFKPRQTQGCRYGEHYFHGDLVSYSYNGYTGTQMVSAVTVEVIGDQAEKISVELKDV